MRRSEELTPHDSEFRGRRALSFRIRRTERGTYMSLTDRLNTVYANEAFVTEKAARFSISTSPPLHSSRPHGAAQRGAGATSLGPQYHVDTISPAWGRPFLLARGATPSRRTSHHLVPPPLALPLLRELAFRTAYLHHPHLVTSSSSPLSSRRRDDVTRSYRARHGCGALVYRNVSAAETEWSSNFSLSRFHLRAEQVLSP